jgi:hypothetical protein
MRNASITMNPANCAPTSRHWPGCPPWRAAVAFCSGAQECLKAKVPPCRGDFSLFRVFLIGAFGFPFTSFVIRRTRGQARVLRVAHKTGRGVQGAVSAGLGKGSPLNVGSPIREIALVAPLVFPRPTLQKPAERGSPIREIALLAPFAPLRRASAEARRTGVHL